MGFTLTPPRALSLDNRINTIIGTLTIVIAVLGTLLAWATWRLTADRRRRYHNAHHGSPILDSMPLQDIPVPPVTTSASVFGYELAFRIGRSR